MHLQSASSTLQRLLTQFLLLLPTMVFSQPCNLQGTYKIGPGGQYPSLTNAIADLMSTGVGGTVPLEFRANYTDSVETFPIFIGNIPCVSAVNEVIIRPEAGAGPILLHSFSSVMTFSGVQFVTLDGRPGGNGTQSGLTLLCNGAGSAAVFTNGAYANWIRYCNLEASNSGSTSGVVSFTTTNSSLGNNNNWISDCYISGRWTSLNGIYSKGTAGKPNQFGRIENSHITGFLAKGICFEENTRHWQIINNDIYQESSVVFQFGPIDGIFVNDTLSDGFTITGNHIGGQAPACGGNPYNVVGSFIGVLMATGTDNLTIIDNNEVDNIHWHNQFSLEYTRVARVQSLMLEREAGVFVLEEGRLALAVPLGDSTCAAVFRGRGTFVFTPRSAVEREQVERFYGPGPMRRTFRNATFVFGDSTLRELTTALAFEADTIGSLGRAWLSTMPYRTTRLARTARPYPVAMSVLEGGDDGMFWAHLTQPDRNEPLFFMLNPTSAERVQLSRRPSMDGVIKGLFVGRNKINSLLNQENVVGLRIYFGLNEEGVPNLVIVGAKATGDDVTSLIVERLRPCPPVCGSGNSLNGN